MANDTWNDQPPPQQSGGCLKGCLIVLGVLFLIIIAVVIVTAIFWRQIMGSFFYEALAAQIDASTYPAEEKEEAKAELARLREAFENKEIGIEDIGRAMTELMKSPVMTMVMANSIEQQYLNKSGLSDEEKADARITLQRFAHGIINEQIDANAAKKVMEPLGTTDADGNFQMKAAVTDEELRAFLANAKAAADEAQVAADPPEADLSDEIKRAVDAALNKVPAEAPTEMPAPPVQAPEAAENPEAPAEP